MGQLLPGTFYKANVLDLQGFNSPPDAPEALTCRLYYNSITNVFHVIDSSGADILVAGSGGVTNIIDDINVTGSVVSDSLILGWQGTLAAGRLNPNVVQNITNDTNIHGTISSQILTFSWSGQLGLSRGGTNADLSASGGATHFLAQDASHVVSARALVAGDVPNIAESQVTGLVSDLALKAPLASPDLTGVPTAPTASFGTNSTQLATTAFVQAAIPAVLVTSVAGRTGAVTLGESDIANLTTDLAAKEATANKGVANGYASLDSGGIVPLAQLPSIVGGTTYAGSWNASTNTPTLASGVGTQGFFYVVSVAGSTTLDGISSWGVGDYAIFNGTVWQKIPSFQAVTSVAGRTGTIVLGESDITNLTSDLALKAPLASPTFTGVPAAPTASTGDSSTTIATTAFVAAKIAAVAPGLAPVQSVAGRTGAITLVENDIANLTTDLGLKAPLASPALTGTPTAPTQSPGNNSTRIATTAYADAAVLVETNARIAADALKANLASPALTGAPTAPTASVDTNTTQLATTAFVLAQASSSLPIIDGTAAIGTSTRYARADHVHPTDVSRAALVSPTFTGTPSAPTAAFGTNSTQLATTAFVQTAVISPAGTVVLNPVADQTITGPYVLEVDSGQFTALGEGLGNILGFPTLVDILATSNTPWALVVRNTLATEGLAMRVNSAGDAFISNASSIGATANLLTLQGVSSGSAIRIGPNSSNGISVGPLVGGASAITINGTVLVNSLTGDGIELGSSGGGTTTLIPAISGATEVQTLPAASGTIALTSDIFPASVAYASNSNIAVSARMVEATGGSLGITLTTLSTSMQNGQTLIIKKVDSGVGSITIIDTNSANFDGDSSYILLDQWQYVSLQWNGTRFNIIGNN